MYYVDDLIDERKIPNPPTSIRFTEAIDKRTGFFGHVTLNITWDGPQSTLSQSHT